MDWLFILGIFLFIFGFLFIAVEVIMPGFGAPGIAGALCLVVGVILTVDTVIEGIIAVCVIFVLISVLVAVLMLLVTKGKIKTKIILNDSLEKDNGYISSRDLQYLVNKKGVTTTGLRPAGKVSVEGVEFDAISEGRFIAKGVDVIVTKTSNSSLVVKSV